MRNKLNPIRKESVKRYPTRREMDVVVFLVSKAGYSSKEWENGLEVADMDDVGMGSLLLYPIGQRNDYRTFKKEISEVTFKDVDGIPVSVSLNIDDEDFLYELDVWKVDFSSVISYNDFYTITDNTHFSNEE